MANFPITRLLLATVSVIGLTLGNTASVYGQDVPTPTPPADGGDFDGAPDPTPDPEVLPTEPAAEPGLEIDNPAPSDTPVLEEGELDNETPATETPDPVAEPGSDEAPADSPIEEGSEPTDTDPTLPTEDSEIEDTAPDPEETPEEDETTTPNGAPANNSPRGLW